MALANFETTCPEPPEPEEKETGVILSEVTSSAPAVRGRPSAAPKRTSVKEAWFEAKPNVPPSTLDRVCQGAYTVLVTEAGHLDAVARVTLPQRMELAVIVASLEQWEEVRRHSLAHRIRYALSADQTTLARLRSEGVAVGLLARVDDAPSLHSTVDGLPGVDLVIIDFKDPTNIPLELILASAQRSHTRVFKKVREAQDGEVSLQTMEAGTDGILLGSEDIAEIDALSTIVQRSTLARFDLRKAMVTRVAHAGMGTRVCVDTTSELAPDEGMLIGSTSNGGFLTCSETHYLPYMKLRPFRVNAGALHLYIWGPNNHAAYLSDLRACEHVYAVNTSGVARPVSIGRLKIERRPLLFIEADIDGTRINTFIQDDWHVRMFGGGGEIRPSSEIRADDRLLGFLDHPGRHVGIAIEETISEV